MNQPTSLCFGRSIFNEIPNPAKDSTVDLDLEQLHHLEEEEVLNYAPQLPNGDNNDSEMANDSRPPNAFGDQLFLGSPPEQLC